MTDFIQRNDAATATDKRSVDILVPVGVFEHGETECEWLVLPHIAFG